MNKNSFFRIKKEAGAILKKSRGAHDLEHTERVLQLALHIGRKEKADLEVLKLAAVLHDIARQAEDKSSGKVDHAALGAEKAGIILKKNGFNAEKIRAVCHCISTHRFRGSEKPVSKEAKCLFDADKLDSIGAVGISRAFLFAGEVGAQLHNKGVDLSKTRPYTREDTAYREFMIKLRKVRSRMLTGEGKRMAEKRHAFMEMFFKQLNIEVEGRA